MLFRKGALFSRHFLCVCALPGTMPFSHKGRLRMEIIMKKLTLSKKSVITAMCIALCIVLPIALHLIPNAGTLLSPMHLPVLLCGLVCGWPFGLLCGILGPVLSSLLTGMPGMAILPSMILELAAYGFLSGLLMRLIHTKSLTLNLYLSLIAAMLAGRIIAGLARALFFSAGNYSFSLWASSYFISTLPGILLQLILIPVIYLALKKARLIEA